MISKGLCLFLTFYSICSGFCSNIVYEADIETHKENLNKIFNIGRIIKYDSEPFAMKDDILELANGVVKNLVDSNIKGDEYFIKDYVEKQPLEAVEKTFILFHLANNVAIQQKFPLFADTFFKCITQLDCYNLDEDGITFKNNNNYQHAVNLFINYIINKALQSVDIDLSVGLLAKIVPLFQNVPIQTINEIFINFLEFCDERLGALQYIIDHDFFKEFLPNELNNITPEEKNLLYLKMLLIIQHLTKCFPTDESSLFDIIVGKNDSQISISLIGTPFNSTYSSQSIFDTFSRRIVFFLSNEIEIIINENENNFAKIFFWTGLARSVVDIFGKLLHQESISNTLFGNFPTRYLEEPWDLYSAPDRFFAIRTLCTENLIEGKYANELTNMHVPHMEVMSLENMSNFLTHIYNCIKSDKNWRDNLLKFIYYFAISSTFSRGQSSIIEWWCTAIANKYGKKISYTYSDIDSKPFKFVVKRFKEKGDSYREILHYIYSSVYQEQFNKHESILKQIAIDFYSQIGQETNIELNKFFWSIHYSFQQKIFAKELYKFLSQILKLTTEENSLQDSLPHFEDLNIELNCNVFNIWKSIFNNTRSLINKVTKNNFDNNIITELCPTTLEKIYLQCSAEYLKSIFSHLDVIALDIFYFSQPKNPSKTEKRFLKIAKELIKFE